MEEHSIHRSLTPRRLRLRRNGRKTLSLTIRLEKFGTIRLEIKHVFVLTIFAALDLFGVVSYCFYADVFQILALWERR